MLEQFEAHLSSSALAPATVVNYLADLRAFFRWNEAAKGADYSPLCLDTQDIDGYRQYLQQNKRHAAATVNRRIQALRKFYQFAVSTGWTAANPADGVSLVSNVTPQRPQCRALADVERVLVAMNDDSKNWAARDRAIIHAMLGAGLKLGELIHLKIIDVHLDGARPYLTVANGDNGNSGERIIPLDSEVCTALQTYAATRQAAPSAGTFFVNEDGRSLSTRSVQRLLHECARTAGLDTLTAQDLRYIYARTAYDSGADVEEVARLLGHRHLATTIRYLRPETE